MFYFVKTPWLVRKFFPGATWNFPTDQKLLYLSFDDGPNARATPFILEQLAKYNARATFFCIGKNVIGEPDLYRRILDRGHRVANHTHNHLNGWKVTDKEYFDNIHLASKYIDSDLFRPPYGKISRFQLRHLMAAPFNLRVIMWDVLSADFDQRLTGDKCALYVIDKAKPGSVIVFHDSEKAFERMRVALPMVLEHFSALGYRFEAIR